MKRNIIIILSISFLIVIMMSIIVFMKTDNSDSKFSDEEIKFKEEYESKNGIAINEEESLKNISVDIDNNVLYLDDSNILNYLTNGNNIIYLGWSEDNNSRTILPVLIETLKENKIENFYYYNLKKVKSAYDNNNDLKKQDIYINMMNIIGIEETTTPEIKRELKPATVVFVKNGKVLGYYEFEKEDFKENLTKTEKSSLKKEYQNYIDVLTK